ncbi:hypothetical protein LEP1GSC170_4277 [Leptospira interrogans serovar Bataviae str. HAI135]|nr:hypothetical protein LEP1GSC170_4277 [Leptospira interrogans serovar Bataviae str. HAI135]
MVIEEFQNAILARKIVLDSLELYKKTFPKNKSILQYVSCRRLNILRNKN